MSRTNQRRAAISLRPSSRPDEKEPAIYLARVTFSSSSGTAVHPAAI
jgi:hypothetical protein